MIDILYKHDERIHNFNAAHEILPYVLNHIQPQSILDVGCGIGTWLAVAKELGVQDVLGIDGWYVDKSKLKISDAEFREHDLREEFSMNRTYDLIISLEVAEHLPEASASTFVSSLCRHGNVILFSAAIPNQGGQNHLNEQWPEYWEALFAKHGFVFYDCLRSVFWGNENIEWWYKQNIFIVAKPGFVFGSTALTQSRPLKLVHPELFEQKLSDARKDLATFKKQVADGYALTFFQICRIIFMKLKELLRLS